MKDLVLRIACLVFGIIYLAYGIFLFVSSKIVIQDNLVGADMVVYFNMFLIAFLCFIGIFLLINGIRFVCYSKPKRKQFFVGLFLILVGYYVFKDNPDAYIFSSDMIILLGTLILFFSPFGLLVPEYCKQKEYEAKVQIIEV